MSAEGWFHLCDLTPAKSLDGSGHHETLGGEEQRPVFKQHIPANTKVMLISDIGEHGCVCRQWGSRSWGSGAEVKGARGVVSIRLGSCYVFNAELLHSCHKPGIILGTGVAVVNKTDKDHGPLGRLQSRDKK